MGTWGENIGMDLTKIWREGVNRIHLAQSPPVPIQQEPNWAPKLAKHVILTATFRSLTLSVISPAQKVMQIWRCVYEVPRMILLPHTCIRTAYWEGSLSKHSPWAAMHLEQGCCHCWKHFWNSCCGIVFSAVVRLFLCIFNILKSLSL
jgi:hypothetical protein